MSVHDEIQKKAARDISIRKRALAEGRARTEELNKQLMMAPKRKWAPLYVEEKPVKKKVFWNVRPDGNPYMK